MAGFYKELIGEPVVFDQPCLTPSIPDSDVHNLQGILGEGWIPQDTSAATVSEGLVWSDFPQGYEETQTSNSDDIRNGIQSMNTISSPVGLSL